MLLIFAGILPAILLDGLSAALARRLPVPRAVPVVAIMLVIGGTRPRRLAPGDHLARPGCGWRTLADLRHRLERRIVVL